VKTFQIKTRHLLVLMVPLALVFAFVGFAHRARREARQSQCHGYLGGQVCLALINLGDRLGRYPPTVTFGPDGKPMHSWRTQVFRELGAPGCSYDFTQPWDSPANLAVASRAYKTYNCPNNQSDSGPLTNYVAIIDRSLSSLDRANKVPRGSPDSADLVLLIEYPNSDILWTEPRDLDVTELDKLADGNDPRGLGVLFADGGFRRMPRAEVLKLFRR